MIHAIRRAATLAAALGTATVALPAPAAAGEGHWSIGHGVQCRIILGRVVCSKTRP